MTTPSPSPAEPCGTVDIIVEAGAGTSAPNPPADQFTFQCPSGQICFQGSGSNFCGAGATL